MLVSHRAELSKAEQEYETLGGSAQLYLVARSPTTIGVGVAGAVRWAYTNRLVPQSKNARKYYEVMKELVGEFDCPTCLRREVDELDHYLPKSKFGHLALTPLNLVPICAKCNKKKRAFSPERVDEQLIHPYFDDLGEFDWLVANLDEVQGAPVTFTIEPPTRWEPALAKRVEFHFEKFDLARLYSKQVTRFLGNLRVALTSRLDRGGPPAVRASLLDYERSWINGGNEPWNVAALRSWGQSEWFCNGGFDPIYISADDRPSAVQVIAFEN